MFKVRPCGCKGCRTCLLCESEFGIEKIDFYKKYKNLNTYIFCPYCNKLYPGWNTDEILSDHNKNNHDNQIGIDFSSVLVKPNFITNEEGVNLMNSLDEIEWQDSQSGRRKQNFGPKTNFKKKKLQNGNFNGFPKFTKFIQEKFNSIELLNKFQTIEQCSLEYQPEKGASIDPHIDDCWIWGERVVTVNCLGDSVLTLTNYKGDKGRYNLDLVETFENHLISNLISDEDLKKFDNIVIRIPMPNLSLIVLFGASRYQFEHSILREDIKERRVCLAYREFTPMYLEDGDNFETGLIITKKAHNFW